MASSRTRRYPRSARWSPVQRARWRTRSHRRCGLLPRAGRASGRTSRCREVTGRRGCASSAGRAECRVVILPREHDLEQRIVCQAPHRLNQFDDLFKRKILVLLRCQNLSPGPLLAVPQRSGNRKDRGAEPDVLAKKPIRFRISICSRLATGVRSTDPAGQTIAQGVRPKRPAVS